MGNNKGFTLVEVVVTVIIVGMLSVIGVAVYRKNINNAKYKEGMHLLQSIKEQQDLSLSFSSSDTLNPFMYTGGLVTSTGFDRRAQNLGLFEVSAENNKYFREFEIKEPENSDETSLIIGAGYVAVAYYPQKTNYKLRLRLIGSTEGPYEVIKD